MTERMRCLKESLETKETGCCLNIIWVSSTQVDREKKNRNRQSWIETWVCLKRRCLRILDIVLF